MERDKKYFTNRILGWNKTKNNRPMPWKNEKDPYKIWLSEIILQQTRVEQGWDYYNKFITSFPNIKKLANAKEEKIFKLWEGLGYYTRCKNLIATAKFIVKNNNSKFPNTYNEILALKGIGPYTAAAIASFAFNLPHAVLDGNVFRVFARFFGIEIAMDSAKGKTIFTQLAQKLLEKTYPGIYNQAIMDFGAVICKPKNPLCSTCPIKTKCTAHLQEKINLLPVKVNKITKTTRWFYYFIIEYKGDIFIRKRIEKDIWENLYEFILLETEKELKTEELKETELFKYFSIKNNDVIMQVSKIYRQQLTHQIIQGVFIKLKLKNALTLKNYKTVTLKQLAKLPFPKLITAYLVKN